MTSVPPLPDMLVTNVVQMALGEDLGDAGDVTTRLTIPAGAKSACTIRARETGTLSGVALAVKAFQLMRARLEITALVTDGTLLKPGQDIIRLEGDGAAILQAERVALNYLGHMSGIASLTARFVKETAGTNANICCTRKTTPGLRALEKYAVRCGGGVNHRYGLYDAVLIKDNHIAIAGGIDAIINRLQNQPASHMVKTEIEVDTLEQLESIRPHLGSLFHAVLLDNMNPQQLTEAVKMMEGHAVAEASGGVNLSTVAAIASTGVDLISAGALTHSASSLDLGLDYD